MKTKKEIAKKIKTAPTKKVVAKVRTISSVKKVATKTKIAQAPKRTIKKVKTIAALKVKNKKSECSLKRVTYMILSLIVGILSAGFMLGLLEKINLENSFKMGIDPSIYPYMGMQLILSPIVYALIFAAGIGFGILLGLWGWRVVYIEHRHRMFQKK